ncbi:endonuclease domain-containing protein [Paenarthrobacter sp. 2TAF44]|uniref:endonuclease domain-containing protein n=1 Tax=Paenarthrobacter sp. 2TAF44 TaxID=3233018 RepID=UPI003F9B546A
MVRINPLPDGLDARPFTVYESRALGVATKRLRAKDVADGGRLIYLPTGREIELLERARVLAAATPGAWVSHETAALLTGLGLPPWMGNEETIHLSKPHQLPRVRRTGVIGHRVRVFPGEVMNHQGVPVSVRPRTWLDLAAELPLPYVIAMGDQLIRRPRPAFESRSEPYAYPSGLRLLIRQHPNLQGVEKARLALDEMRVGADSYPETFLRLAMRDGGLPEPELQLPLDPLDPISPRADLGYRRFRIAVQYDGAHHLTREQQSKDNRRDEAFLSAGWSYFKVNADDLAEGFAGAIARIKKAKLRAM